ncbi:MAG: MBL fold metallo-hydrolase [Gammaproteobacteria bacterium]
MTNTSITEELGNGITVVDTGLMADDMVACYLMQSDGEVAIIETGNYQTCERLLMVLSEKQIAPEQVKYVIVTHIHLDHAGGASHLMHALPNATLLVHPSGVKHMANPAKLVAASTQVYGEARFRAMYGDITAIAEDRIIAIQDDATMQLGQRLLRFRHTPGHAYHHMCIFDEEHSAWFTGDTFGLCYRAMKCAADMPFIIPTTTPTQFDPEALKASIRLLLENRPTFMLLTHHGQVRIDDHDYIEHWLIKQIEDFCAITKDSVPTLENHHQLVELLMDYYLELIAEKQLKLEPEVARNLLAMDLELNAQGLWYWHQKHFS